MENLPEDLQTVLTDTLYDLSKVSIIILSVVNKFYNQMSNRCRIKYNMKGIFIKPVVCDAIAEYSTLCSAIALEGSVELLKWAIRNGYKTNWTTGACAASNGHVEILEWLHSKKNCECKTICFWAARNGQLDVLIWARVNGYEWDESTSIMAVINRHLNVFIWLRDNGCPVSSDTEQKAKKLWLSQYA